MAYFFLAFFSLFPSFLKVCVFWIAFPFLFAFMKEEREVYGVHDSTGMR